MKKSSRGFTLIELLVVVAIIALLIAILLPSLAHARDVAKTAVCASNMRQVGYAVHLFAAENDGRSPGYGATTSSMAWVEILNTEVFRRSKGTKYAIQARFGENPGGEVKMLACTKYNRPSGDAHRPWVYSSVANAANAASTGRGDMVVDGTFDKQWYYTQAGIATVTQYYLGAKLQFFASSQVLMHESYASNDVASSVTTPDNRGRIVAPLVQGPQWMVASNPGPLPGYSRDNLAFRHPYFKGTNVLKHDASVSTMKPSDDVANGPGQRNKWALER